MSTGHPSGDLHYAGCRTYRNINSPAWEFKHYYLVTQLQRVRQGPVRWRDLSLDVAQVRAGHVDALDDADDLSSGDPGNGRRARAAGAGVRSQSRHVGLRAPGVEGHASSY